jgi:tRNA1(Val) A37 N6-methylase TrmN6
MTQQELKQIFQNPYERKAWLEVLKNVFSKVSIFAQPQDLFQEVDSVIDGSQIGLIQLTDDKNIAIFEVEVADNISILHNRKGLRDIAAKHIDQGIIHGALVFFYSQCQSEYRFTFIAKHTEFDDDGNLNKIQTHPKRYTYVLGTPYCGTAVQRISTLAVKNQLSPLVIKDVIEAFSVEALTKEFYSELSNWYFWALQNVKFPDDFEQDEEVRNATSTIRLITRLMFVWFLKQKGLIPDGLFDKEELKKILNYSDKTGSTFYKAILQNLFFATLNTEMSGDKRKFVNRQYGVQGFYRYERFFSNKERFLELTKDIPFLNGGLFENLDKNVGKENEIRIDCFSNIIANENRLSVPDYLFFDGTEHADLSGAYGDSNHGNTKVRGLIEILKSYNFTIEENTPYEIEVALDPELLGKVFENLLASYNPETKTTARKQTGSFYTPREIVSYMVDESILAFLKNKLLEEAAGVAVIGNPQIEIFGNETRKGQLSLEQKINSSKWVGKEKELEDNLRLILAYNGDENPFDAKDTALLIKAIDNCKILDPACGSGAFPMGVLQKMVHILQKLDKDNSQWRELQRQKAIAETEKAYNIGDKDERQKRLLDIDETFDYNASDYGRKLYLIENCIYGVDIQPIAVQIAKLRFFISLVCDQKEDKNRDNLGIRPLPNLETKFVAANSLIGINRSGGVLRILEVVEKEKELAEVRHKHFLARTPETKAKYRKKDEELRHHIATLLKNNGWGDAVARLLADWNPYDQNISAKFFDTEWMFGLLQGFDIVIGNPPYVQLQKDGGKLAIELKSQNYETFEKTGDIYSLFYEKGFQILKNGGIHTFITSSQWMKAAYGKSLRKYFLKQNPLKLILLGPGAFENATVDTNILVAQKGRNKKELKGTIINSNLTVLTEKDYVAMPYITEAAWAIIDNSKQTIKTKIESKGKALKDWNIKINFGIKTGINEVFIIDQSKRDELIYIHKSAEELIRPLLRGRTINKFQTEWDGDFIISTFPALQIDIEKFPSIKQYLQQFRPKIDQIGKEFVNEQGQKEKTRKKTSNEWFETQDQIGYVNEFKKEKIVWKRIGSQLRFSYVDDEIYCLDSTCIATGEKVKYLTALLNSKLCNYELFENAPKTGMGDLIISVQALEPLHVYYPKDKEEKQIVTLVDHILAAKKADPQADTLPWEAEIDARVFQLYGLTEEEMLQVLGSLPGVSEGERREIQAQWHLVNKEQKV